MFTENDIKNLSLDQKTEVKISDKNYKGSISYIAKHQILLQETLKLKFKLIMLKILSVVYHQKLE